MVSTPEASSTLCCLSMRWTMAPETLTRTSSNGWELGFCKTASFSSGKRFSASSFTSREGYSDEDEAEVGFEIRGEVASGFERSTSG